MTVWYLYVDFHTLSNTSDVLDQLMSFDINEDREQLLFAVTDKKKYVERFFELHRREMFSVIKKKVDKNTFWKGIKDNPNSLGQFVLEKSPLRLLIHTKNDKLATVVYPSVVAKHENISISLGLEGTDDLIYDLYCQSELLQEMYHVGVFDKKFKKLLDATGFIQTLSNIDEWYHTKSSDVPNMILNEWAILKKIYKDVLIGGDSDDSPLI